MPENYVFKLVLIKVDKKDITLSRLCYYIYINACICVVIRDNLEIYREYTTEEGLRSVQRIYSFVRNIGVYESAPISRRHDVAHCLNNHKSLH